MDSDNTNVFSFIGQAVVVFLVIAIVLALISFVVLVACAGGFLWGGGTALVNYASSIKENLIDSNLRAA